MPRMKWNDFRGVDFLNDKPDFRRSPDAKNVWYKYGIDGKRLETRPGQTLLGTFPNGINGLFFYTVNNTEIVIVHSGTKLYTWDNFPNAPVFPSEEEGAPEPTVTQIYTGMNPFPSQAFVFNNILFIKDGINYLEFNGTTVSEVVGTIPITSRDKKPTGEVINDDGSVVYQAVNLLQPKRMNAFVGDGESKDYYLDTKDLDPSTTFVMTATVDGLTKVEGVDFEVDRTNGIVTFNSAPPKPLQDGESNVIITFSKTINGYADRIKKCTIMQDFDKRLFFSGNQDYPNYVFHSELEDPRYVRDNAYYQEGLDRAPVKTIIKGNDSVWVIKESVNNNPTIYYHVPTLDYTYGKIYPSYESNISTGCTSTGTNFNDDIVFFSKRGMESINGEIKSETLLAHRSSLVDSKMANSTNYDTLKLCEYEGYLMCLVNSKVYLADSRQKFTNEATGEVEYEWFYWELPNSITYIKAHNNDLYYGNDLGQIFKASGTTDNGMAIDSYWTIPKENFGTDTQLKTTNKRGGVADVKIVTDGKIKVYVRADNEITWTFIGEYDVDKGYIVYRIKKKKFKNIQLRFSSSNFGLFSIDLEAFIGAFVKR